MNKPTHRYDEIRQRPITFHSVHKSIYRSHHILQEVKRMLAEFYNSDAILDIIALLETDLPNQPVNTIVNGISKEEFEREIERARLAAKEIGENMTNLIHHRRINDVR